MKFDGSDQQQQQNQLPDLLNGTLHNNSLSNDSDPKLLFKNIGNGFGGSSHLNMNGEKNAELLFASFLYCCFLMKFFFC